MSGFRFDDGLLEDEPLEPAPAVVTGKTRPASRPPTTGSSFFAPGVVDDDPLDASAWPDSDFTGEVNSQNSNKRGWGLSFPQKLPDMPPANAMPDESLLWKRDDLPLDLPGLRIPGQVGGAIAKDVRQPSGIVKGVTDRAGAVVQGFKQSFVDTESGFDSKGEAIKNYLSGDLLSENRKEAFADAAYRFEAGDDEYLRIARKGLERDAQHNDPNSRRTLVEKAHNGRMARITPEEANSQWGARQIAMDIEGGAMASTYFPGMNEQEIAQELRKMDEGFLREMATNRAEAREKIEPLDFWGNTGNTIGSVIQTGADYANWLYIGRKLMTQPLSESKIKKAPQVGLDESGKLVVTQPGRGPVTNADVLKAYGWNWFEYATEQFLFTIGGALVRKLVPGARGATKQVLAKVGRKIDDTPGFRLLKNNKVVDALKRARKSEKWQKTKKHTGVGSAPEEVTEEFVQGVGEAVFNLEGAPEPMYRRVGEATIEFAKQAPSLALGMMIVSGGRVSATVPFERKDRRKRAESDAVFLQRSLEVNGVDMSKKDASAFLFDLYGTETAGAQWTKVQGFLEKHGVESDTKSPLIRNLHAEFKDMDRESFPRKRFLRALNDSNQELRAEFARVQKEIQRRQEREEAWKDTNRNALFSELIPEYGKIAQVMNQLASRPRDVTNGGKPVVSNDEQAEIEQIAKDDAFAWNEYLKGANNDPVLALQAYKLDLEQDRDSGQAAEQEAAEGAANAPQQNDETRPQLESAVDGGIATPSESVAGAVAGQEEGRPQSLPQEEVVQDSVSMETRQGSAEDQQGAEDGGQLTGDIQRSPAYQKKLDDRMAAYAKHAQNATDEQLEATLTEIGDPPAWPTDGINLMRKQAIEAELQRRKQAQQPKKAKGPKPIKEMSKRAIRAELKKRGKTKIGQTPIAQVKDMKKLQDALQRKRTSDEKPKDARRSRGRVTYKNGRVTPVLDYITSHGGIKSLRMVQAEAKRQDRKYSGGEYDGIKDNLKSVTGFGIWSKDGLSVDQMLQQMVADNPSWFSDESAYDEMWDRVQAEVAEYKKRKADGTLDDIEESEVEGQAEAEEGQRQLEEHWAQVQRDIEDLEKTIPDAIARGELIAAGTDVYISDSAPSTHRIDDIEVVENRGELSFVYVLTDNESGETLNVPAVDASFDVAESPADGDDVFGDDVDFLGDMEFDEDESTEDTQDVEQVSNGGEQEAAGTETPVYAQGNGQDGREPGRNEAGQQGTSADSGSSLALIAEEPTGPELNVPTSLADPTFDQIEDPNFMPGVHYRVAPNAVNVQLRGLDVMPIAQGRTAWPYNGTAEDAATVLADNLLEFADSSEFSHRESIFVATDKNGVARFWLIPKVFDKRVRVIPVQNWEWAKKAWGVKESKKPSPKANARGDNLLGDQEADTFNLIQDEAQDGARVQSERDKEREKAQRDKEREEAEQNTLFGADAVEKAIFIRDREGRKIKVSTVDDYRTWIDQQKAKFPKAKREAHLKMFDSLRDGNGEQSAINYARKLAGLPVESTEAEEEKQKQWVQGQTKSRKKYQPVMTANSKVPDGLTYEQFKIEYENALKQGQAYTPKSAGFGIWSEQMAKLADKYPDFEKRIDAEADAGTKDSGVKTKLSDAEFETIVADALRWQGAHINAEREYVDRGDNKGAMELAVTSGKSVLDDYLMGAHNITRDLAHMVSNYIESMDMKPDSKAKIEDFAGQSWADKAIAAREADQNTDSDLAFPLFGADTPLWKIPEGGIAKRADGGNVYTFRHFDNQSDAENVAESIRNIAQNAEVFPWIKKKPNGRRGVPMWDVRVNNVSDSLAERLNSIRSEQYKAIAAREAEQYKNTVLGADVMTRAMEPTLKAASIKGDDALWYHQGDVMQTVFNAAQSGASDYEIKTAAEIKAAQAAGYSPVRYRISGLQGVYVFQTPNHPTTQARILTKAGMESLVGDKANSNNVGPHDNWRTQISSARIYATNLGIQEQIGEDNWSDLDAIVSAIDKHLTSTPQMNDEGAIRTMDEDGRVSDGRGGIQAGDVFKTSSGRTTTPYPNLSKRMHKGDMRKANAWLIDNYRAEAQARGDNFNVTLANGMNPENFPPADGDGANMYLFGEQPAVAPPITKPLTAPRKSPPKRDKVQVKSARDNLDPVKRAKLDELQAKLRGNLLGGSSMNAMLNPENVAITAQIAQLYSEGGVKTFRQFAGNVAVDMADVWDMVKDFLHGAWQMAGSQDDSLDDVSRTDARTVISEIDAGEQTSDTIDSEGDVTDAPATTSNLEQDSGMAETTDEVGTGNVDDRGPGEGSGNTESSSRAVEEAGDRGYSDSVLSDGRTTGNGTRADPGLREGKARPGSDERATGSSEQAGRGESNDSRTPPDPRTTDFFVEPVSRSDGETLKHVAPDNRAGSRQKQQRDADQRNVKVTDIANIRQTLPLLLPGQQDDVLFTETRFNKPNGHGVLFTNGTGTGKTYTGTGIIKRFVRQGKGNVLILAPSQEVIRGWMKSGNDILLPIKQLQDTNDNGGKGVVITTYANFRANPALVARKWDLVVADESQHLLQRKDSFDVSSTGEMFRAVTHHPRGQWKHFAMQNHKFLEKFDDVKAQHKQAVKDFGSDSPQAKKLGHQREDMDKKYEALRTAHTQEYAKLSESARSKVVFLSATPFAYVPNVDYAEGFLFDYAQVEDSQGYNTSNGQQKFFIEHFGYSMRYNKLTRPDREVDNDVMEREFNEFLRKENVVSNRRLDINADYERRFVLAPDKIGQDIDAGMKVLSEEYPALHDIARKHFDYLHQLYLLEALKAKHAVPLIREHMERGKKVVVFHDFNKGGGFHPFDFSSLRGDVTVTLPDGSSAQVAVEELVKDFNSKHPQFHQMDFSNLAAPIHALRNAFPDAGLVNGKESKKDVDAAITRFNDDASGPQLIVVQSAKGQAGISLHDETGKHPRVMINLGLPSRPVTAIQEEGRIYRTGQADGSNSLYLYMNTGTSWEAWAFAQKMFERSSTAENLAMGYQARRLRQTFVEAFDSAEEYKWTETEGTGGKEHDRSADVIDDYKRAKSFYFGRQKKTSKTKAAEGTDYFATPEPLGLKMVEWADVSPGDHILEPSAGHGAISRWFSEITDNTIVEQSPDLAAQAAVHGNAKTKVIQGSFEDHYIGNKYHAITMNPPFGTAGKTAMDHVAKAFGHLVRGGRVIAIIPDGASMQKRFDKWYEDTKDAALVADIKLPGVVFKRAGTSVATRVVVIDRVDDQMEPVNDYRRMDIDATDVNEFFDRIEDIELPPRQRVERHPPKPQQTDNNDSGADVASILQSGRDAVLPDNPGVKESLTVESQGEPDIVEHYHTKREQNVYILKPLTRMEKEQFNSVRRLAKQAGGWYSRKWEKSPAGFAFESREAAREFAQEHAGVFLPDDVKYQDAAQGESAVTRESVEADAVGIAERIGADWIPAAGEGPSVGSMQIGPVSVEVLHAPVPGNVSGKAGAFVRKGNSVRVYVDPVSGKRTTVAHELQHLTNAVLNKAERDAVKHYLGYNLATKKGEEDFTRQMETQEGRNRLADKLRSLSSDAREMVVSAINQVVRLINGVFGTNIAEFSDLDRDLRSSLAESLEGFGALRRLIEQGGVDNSTQSGYIGNRNESENKISTGSNQRTAGQRESSGPNAFAQNMPQTATSKRAANAVTKRSLRNIPSPSRITALSDAERAEEIDNLKRWAQANDSVLDLNDIVSGADDNSRNFGGAEHDVFGFTSKESPYILRITKQNSYGHAWFNGSVSQYLKRITEFNHLFPYAKIEMMGVVLREDGHPAIATKQPFIPGNTYTSIKKFEKALRDSGYKPVKFGSVWVDENTGIVLEDVTLDNVIFQSDGTPKFIDVIVDSNTLADETLDDIYGFSSDSTDVRYQDVSPAQEKANQAYQAAKDFAASTLDTVLRRQIKSTNAKADISHLDLGLSTIMHYSSKVPGLRKVYESAERFIDNKHYFESLIFNNGFNGEGSSDIELISNFAAVKKLGLDVAKSPEWVRLEKYLWDRDRDAIGYRVQETSKRKFQIITPGSKASPSVMLNDAYQSEDMAWEVAREFEARDLVKMGFSKKAAAVLQAVRRINRRRYKQLLGEVQSAANELENMGLSLKKVKNAKGEMVDIFDALREMGSLQGHYMPRLRKSGDYLLYAHKEGENPIMKTFATPVMRGKEAKSLERQGYKVEALESNKPSEEAFLDASIIAMNDMMQNALSRVHDIKEDEVTLDKYGLRGEWVDYELQNGDIEQHYVLEGPLTKAQHATLKSLGGRLISIEGGPRRWRFMGATKGIEKRILSALAHREMLQIQANAFGEAIVQNIADMIHSRGSRSSKIARREGKGKDVYLGYEMDAVRALVLAGKSTAGGTSKRIMAKEMMRAITGQEQTWGEYVQSNYEMLSNLPTQADYDEAKAQLYNQYAKQVEDNRIDSAKQKNAYKDAIAYMRDMLRNNEPSERVIGMLKGITALKYMSSVSSGLVNLSSMYITVPAAMRAYGDINIKDAIPLISKQMKNYVKFYMHEKFGKGEGLKGDDAKLFNEITKRGWDQAMMNHEALNALQGNVSRAHAKVVEIFLLSYAVVERLNRVSTIAAAYRGIKANHKGEWNIEAQDKALHQAKYISDKANAAFGKTNLPAITRGSSLGAQTLRSAYMFKSFTHNYVIILVEMLAKKDFPSAFYLLLSQGVIGGAAANALTIPLKYLAKLIAAAIPGMEPPDDPEEAFYEWVGETFGRTASRFARFGIVGGLTGISIKSSLTMDMRLPTTIVDFIGAPASVVQDVVYATQNIARGNYIKGAEQMLPRAFANPLRAYRERTEGITSRSNQPLFYGVNRMKANWYETLLRGVGFNPATIAEMREIQWKERTIERDYNEKRTEIYERMRRFFLLPPEKQTRERWFELMQMVQDYNARVAKRGRDNVSMIKPSTIQSVHTKMFTPPKRERIRAMKLQNAE